MLSQRRDQGVAALPAARPQSGQMTLEVAPDMNAATTLCGSVGDVSSWIALVRARRSRAADGPTSQPIRKLALEIFDMLP